MDTSYCPDNSTECLLRVLILASETQTSPWEPKNFALSVVTGVSAFLISILVIFQGLLAAGPGRIKASSAAIGHFSQFTRGRLSWIEFAWRSTAYVPVMKLEALQLDLWGQRPVEEHGTDYPFTAGAKSTGATWMQLLTCIGLNNEDVGIYFPKRCRQPCSTDHLPADIQAPLAVAQLRCLAILVAIADTTVTIEKTHEGLSIVGKASQISFRNHPVLGTLAAYEHYQTELSEVQEAANQYGSSRYYASLGRCSKLALLLAEGSFEIEWDEFTLRQEVFNIILCSHCTAERTADVFIFCADDPPYLLGNTEKAWAKALALTVARTDYEVRPFPWNRSGLRASIEVLKQTIPDLFKSSDNMSRMMEPLGLDKESGHQPLDKEDFEVADILFESWGTWIVPVQTGMPPDFGEFGTGLTEALFDMCSHCLERLEDGKRHKLDIFNVEHVTKALKLVDIALRRKRTLTIQAYNEMLARLAGAGAAQGWGFPEQPLQVGSYKSIAQLTAVQKNRAQQISAQKGLSQKLIRKASPFGSGVKKTNQDSQTSQTSQAGMQVSSDHEPEVQSLEALLIVRAVLFAGLLEAGPDTSILFEPDFQNSMVRIM